MDSKERRNNIILASGKCMPYLVFERKGSVRDAPIFTDSKLGPSFEIEGKQYTFEYTPVFGRHEDMFERLSELEYNISLEHYNPSHWALTELKEGKNNKEIIKTALGYGMPDFLTAVEDFGSTYLIYNVAIWTDGSLVKTRGRIKKKEIIVDGIESFSSSTGTDRKLLEVFPDPRSEEKGKCIGKAYYNKSEGSNEIMRARYLAGAWTWRNFEFPPPEKRKLVTLQPEIGFFIVEKEDKLPDEQVLPQLYYKGRRVLPAGYGSSSAISFARGSGGLIICDIESYGDIFSVSIRDAVPISRKKKN